MIGESVHSLPVGSALLRYAYIGPTPALATVRVVCSLRTSTEAVERLAKCPTIEVRARRFHRRGTDDRTVVLFVLMCRVGPELYGPVFVNEYAPGSHFVEHLVTQPTIFIELCDHRSTFHRWEMPNTVFDAACRTLGCISAVPAWTPRAFQIGREAVEQRFPDVGELWEDLAYPHTRPLTETRRCPAYRATGQTS